VLPQDAATARAVPAGVQTSITGAAVRAERKLPRPSLPVTATQPASSSSLKQRQDRPAAARRKKAAVVHPNRDGASPSATEADSSAVNTAAVPALVQLQRKPITGHLHGRLQSTSSASSSSSSNSVFTSRDVSSERGEPNSTAAAAATAVLAKSVLFSSAACASQGGSVAPAHAVMCAAAAVSSLHIVHLYIAMPCDIATYYTILYNTVLF
jgi:microcystin-dependent protein